MTERTGRHLTDTPSSPAGAGYDVAVDTAGSQPAPGPSPHQRPADLRTATLDAAARLLARDGPAGLATRRIAAEAGCSTIAVYHYFDNKQGLLDALHTEGHKRLQDAQRVHQLTDDAEADVRNTCLAYRAVALAYPDYFRIMFSDRIDGLPRPADATRSVARENYAAFIEVVRRWDQQHPLRTNPESAAYSLWAAGHGMVLLELTANGPREDRDAHYTTMIDALMRGLQA